MVHSQRHEYGKASSSRIFDGSSNVRMFLFTFENVAMREEKEEENALELLKFFDGRAFEFFSECSAGGEVITAKSADFLTVKAALLEELEKREEPQKIIRVPMYATLDSRNLTNSLSAMNVLVMKAEFNEKAKFGISRTNVMSVLESCRFAKYRYLSSYKELKKFVRDFEKTVRIRLDTLVQNVETMIDTPAEQLAKISFIVKKHTEKNYAGGGEMEKVCSYCRESG